MLVEVHKKCTRYILDAKDPGVELEPGNAEVVRDGQLVKPPPYPRHSLERQRGHDLNLPRPIQLGPRPGLHPVSILQLSRLVLLSGLNLVKLHQTQKPDTQAYRYRVPRHLAIPQRLAQALGEPRPFGSAIARGEGFAVWLVSRRVGGQGRGRTAEGSTSWTEDCASREGYTEGRHCAGFDDGRKAMLVVML